MFFTTTTLEDGQPWNISGIFENEIVIIPQNINNSHWTISVAFFEKKGNIIL